LEGIEYRRNLAGSSSSENSSQGYGTGESKQNSLSFALYVTKLKYAYRNKNSICIMDMAHLENIPFNTPPILTNKRRQISFLAD